MHLLPSALPFPVTNLRFQKHQHLRKPAEFERVYGGKRRGGDARLLVYATANGSAVTRIGLSVSRRHGGSVQRQRIKRLLREAFRLSQHELPSGLDLVLIPKPETTCTVEDYRASLRTVVEKLARQLRRAPDANAIQRPAAGDDAEPQP
jgi:ribonuclease P protein component